ncbi:MAG: CsgG/HfaB family protein [Candidatus Zhuqueibacterota bacterium]
MKKIFILSLPLFLFISLISFSHATEKTIALLDFSNNSLFDKEKYSSLSPGLAEIMITELSKIKAFKLVERKKINALIEEMQLSQSGLISEESNIQVGKLLGAQYLVFGSYMVNSKDKVRIDVRIVEVETGLTIKAEEVTDKLDKIFDIIKKLNDKIIKDLDIKLSSAERQTLDEGSASLEVIAYFSQGIAFEEKKEFEKAKQMYIKALKSDQSYEPAKTRLKELMQK